MISGAWRQAEIRVVYGIPEYGEMISDGVRMDAYARALRKVVKPGCVVLDIGTGTGVAAMLACQLGARRVYAIEPNDAIFVAQEIAAANGYGATIQFFQALSTEVTLPEPADVIVSDMRGILPFYRNHLVAIADARARHLARDGVMIPQSDTLWVAAVNAPQLYDSLTSPWSGKTFGLDMSAARRLAINSFCRLKADAADIVSAAQSVGTIDYRAVESFGFSGAADLPVAEAATANGLCVWFDSTLAEGVEMSNAPDRPRLIYGSAFFPWLEPVHLEPGDVVRVALRADLVGGDYEWQWHTRVSAGDRRPQLKADMRQSEFQGRLLSPVTLGKHSASHTPRLGEDGQIDQLILRLMEDGLALGNIARAVTQRYPDRFARWQDALTRVGDLSVRYSR